MKPNFFWQIWNFIRLIGKDIVIGEGCSIHPGASFSTQYGGFVRIGRRTDIRRGAILMTYGGTIAIGDNCSINPYCILYGHGRLTIGNGVRIGTHSSFIPVNHNIDDLDTFIYQQGLTCRGIVIEDDVWIGAGVVVVDGVTIARGSVIGANAVVTRSTEPNGVYVGVPARKLRSRGELPSSPFKNSDAICSAQVADCR